MYLLHVMSRQQKLLVIQVGMAIRLQAGALLGLSRLHLFGGKEVDLGLGS